MEFILFLSCLHWLFSSAHHSCVFLSHKVGSSPKGSETSVWLETSAECPFAFSLATRKWRRFHGEIWISHRFFCSQKKCNVKKWTWGSSFMFNRRPFFKAFLIEGRAFSSPSSPSDVPRMQLTCFPPMHFTSRLTPGTQPLCEATGSFKAPGPSWPGFFVDILRYFTKTGFTWFHHRRDWFTNLGLEHLRLILWWFFDGCCIL